MTDRTLIHRLEEERDKLIVRGMLSGREHEQRRRVLDVIERAIGAIDLVDELRRHATLGDCQAHPALAAALADAADAIHRGPQNFIRGCRYCGVGRIYVDASDRLTARCTRCPHLLRRREDLDGANLLIEPALVPWQTVRSGHALETRT